MAAEVRVLALQSPQLIINELAARFTRESGFTIVELLDIAELPAHARRRIDAGEAFDAAFIEDVQLTQLAQERKVVGATRRNFLRVPIGVAVKTGAAKPNIETVEAFRHAVLAAKSVAYLNGGRSGPYLQDLFARWGIGAAIAAKERRPDTDTVGELVAAGEAELGITAIATLMATRGVEIVGRIPVAIQSYVCFAGAVGAKARMPDGAKALIEFVTGPAAFAVIRAKGMEAWADNTPAN